MSKDHNKNRDPMTFAQAERMIMLLELMLHQDHELAHRKNVDCPICMRHASAKLGM